MRRKAGRASRGSARLSFTGRYPLFPQALSQSGSTISINQKTEGLIFSKCEAQSFTVVHPLCHLDLLCLCLSMALDLSVWGQRWWPNISCRAVTSTA